MKKYNPSKNLPSWKQVKAELEKDRLEWLKTKVDMEKAHAQAKAFEDNLKEEENEQK